MQSFGKRANKWHFCFLNFLVYATFSKIMDKFILKNLPQVRKSMNEIMGIELTEELILMAKRLKVFAA